MFTKKDREIANLKAMVANRNVLIENQERLIKTQTQMINSLEDDIKSLREEAYKTAKKRTSRPQIKLVQNKNFLI